MVLNKKYQIGAELNRVKRYLDICIFRKSPNGSFKKTSCKIFRENWRRKEISFLAGRRPKDWMEGRFYTNTQTQSSSDAWFTIGNWRWRSFLYALHPLIGFFTVKQPSPDCLLEFHRIREYRDDLCWMWCSGVVVCATAFLKVRSSCIGDHSDGHFF